MKAQRATMRDFREVKQQLADRLADEYRAAGYGESEALASLKPLLRQGQADAIVSDEGEVLAILFYYIEGGIVHTAFAAKEAFFCGLSLRIARRHLKELQRRLGGLEIRSNSFPQDPRTERWFSKIGFRIQERNTSNIVFALPAQ